jgi:group I intron endonuclease
MFVYKIENLNNGKVYIGQTKCFLTRMKSHVCKLNSNKHTNKHLQFSWNKHGKENFSFEILEEPSIEKSDEREVFWINHYSSNIRENGYNIEHGGVLVKNLGEETKQRISNALKGKYTGEKNHMFGKSPSEETLKLMSIVHSGKIMPENAKIVLSYLNSGKLNPFYGKNHSVEKRKIIGDAARGRKYSEDMKKRLSKLNSGENNPSFGKKPSSETLLKMSLGAKEHNFSGKRNPSFGVSPSRKTREKISESLRKRESGRKTKGINLVTLEEKTFKSVEEAASFIGHKSTDLVRRVCKGKLKKTRNWYFCYIV